ncbi:Carnitinyl-CoA dehydratase [Variovorax sp. SRS16]|uniref:enoyl-CoA hydratase/isomerase family protein n=1 Tax=Variovorax sp. SRS16 TaxID=282217 RepID=UPI0013193A97|nr:enoyl-CoA hydratase/isomerase family protein [Variovorax sp. SRS16]VTU21570.1 Carnitinyl-CoA dehydratase [Variovorax sp. SRS16]
MTPQTIELGESVLRIDEGVAEFSHQRPAARNAMSMALRKDYEAMLARVTAERDIRVLIITGSGGSFCAGGDVKGMNERLHNPDPEFNSPDATRRRLQDSHRWLTPLRELDVPVIAAVDGAAYGAGFGLALQADFVLASTRAAFCMSFARMGAVPDYGALYTLPRIIGLAAAKDVMFTARRIDAAEARALGFVHAVHEPDALLREAHAFARRLCDGPREATAMTKDLLNKSFETDYATMCSLEACAQGIAMHTPYHAEAAARFSRGEPSLYDWDRPAAAR